MGAFVCARSFGQAEQFGVCLHAVTKHPLKGPLKPTILKNVLILGGERESLSSCSTYLCIIGSSVLVVCAWPEMEPVTLAYWDD